MEMFDEFRSVYHRVALLGAEFLFDDVDKQNVPDLEWKIRLSFSGHVATRRTICVMAIISSWGAGLSSANRSEGP
jgi:hypothetical protein